LLVDRRDRRRDDRREEDEEAPEDERVHQAGDEPLQQLPLAEHDHSLVADAPREVTRAVDRPPLPDEPDEEERAPREQPAADRHERDEPERAGDDGYPRAFLSSALIAGTISCRLPITA
jgi:hypothetical protein